MGVLDDLKEGTKLGWISGKIVLFGKAVGVTVDAYPGGWDDVIRFAHPRKQQNREDFYISKGKKKGTRELQKLSSSVNYEKTREGKQRHGSACRGERKGKGIMSSGQ